MKKIGLFGGTFNPVHTGHLNLLRQVQAQMQFDELLLIPSHLPPHKEASDLASGKDRLQMLALAVEDIPEAGVCDIELHKSGKSYTIETLRKLRRLFPTAEFYFIVGTDMLLTFDEWKQWRDILKLAYLVASSRDEGEYERLCEKAQKLDRERILVLKTQPFPLSSTEIRRKLKAGEDVAELLSPKVLRYIEQKGLYR
ncbi:MAG: nicotinate (nicotinamide) nucleotide adenylyltransferase [Clostridiales bacterium]|nr:MAG: nicotinate (nicotinamide) nucleotide adenylyltransferase [Clostridiales bacterium]